MRLSNREIALPKNICRCFIGKTDEFYSKKAHIRLPCRRLIATLRQHVIIVLTNRHKKPPPQSTVLTDTTLALSTSKRTVGMEIDKNGIEIKTIKTFVDLKDKRVLEIGCGNGRISWSLAPEAKTYVAIDPDGDCIREASARIEAAVCKIGNGEQLEFEDGCFDVVLFTLSLHHQDGRRALNEAHRVLCTGGQLIILEPCFDSELEQYFNLFNDETEILHKTHRIIERSPFQLQSHETYYTLWGFTDVNELYSYPFGGTDTTLDDRMKEEMNALLGSKIDDCPILIHDKTHLFSLKK